jgi:putative transposase
MTKEISKMKKSRFSEEQIVKALQEHEIGGKTIVAISRELGIAQATFHKWKQKYGGLNVNEAKRLKELETENSRLKRMVADLMLENEAVKDVLKKL